MSTIVRTTDWETFTTLLALPETAVIDIDEHETGSVTYLAGRVDVDGDTIAAFLADCLVAADRFVVLEDGTYVRITGGGLNGEDAGQLTLDQSRVIPWQNGVNGPFVELRVVEPSPPTMPSLSEGWFPGEVTRALLDHNA